MASGVISLLDWRLKDAILRSAVDGRCLGSDGQRSRGTRSAGRVDYGGCDHARGSRTLCRRSRLRIWWRRLVGRECWGFQWGSLLDATPEDWKTTFDLTLFHAARATRAVVLSMSEQRAICFFYLWPEAGSSAMAMALPKPPSFTPHAALPSNSPLKTPTSQSMMPGAAPGVLVLRPETTGCRLANLHLLPSRISAL